MFVYSFINVYRKCPCVLNKTYLIHLPVLTVVAGDFEGGLSRVGDLVGLMSSFAGEPVSSLLGSGSVENAFPSKSH